MPNGSKPKSVPRQSRDTINLSKKLAREKRQREITKLKAQRSREKARENDRYLKRILKAVKGKGIYDPKDISLTKYRKTRLGKIAKEFGDFLDPTKFTFVAPDKKAKKKVLERATALEMKTTRSGIFVAKEGNPRVKIKHDKKRDEYYIERSGKTKWGINTGKRYRTVTPLASVDEIANETERLREMADRFGPLSKRERISFEITERGNEGHSHATFNNIEGLLNYLEQYKKTIAARINFYRHIKIVKTESVDKWFSMHPVKAPKKFSRRAHTRGKRGEP